jgi:hypothetical protein
MPEWVNKLNEMFANNCWTDNNRVKIVDYNDAENIVSIKVCNKIKNMDITGRNDYQIMMDIMREVDNMYWS